METSDNAEIKALYNRIKELLDSDRIRQIRSKDDEDARFGHKTTTSTFFGYKTHIAMNDDRIITGSLSLQTRESCAQFLGISCLAFTLMVMAVAASDRVR